MVRRIVIGNLLLLSAPAAVTIWWGGNGGDVNQWDLSQNWSEKAAPSSSDTVQFDNTADANNLKPGIDGSDAAVAAILFAESTKNTYEVGGRGTLLIGGSSRITLTNAGIADQTVRFANIQLAESQTWTVSGSGNLTITSDISAKDYSLTLSGESAGAGIIRGSISGEGGKIVKTDRGTWTLAGENDFKGSTLIEAGRLIFSGKNASVGDVAVGVGGTLQIDASDTLPPSTPLLLAGGSLALGGRYSQTFTVPLAMTVDSTIDFGRGHGGSLIAFGNSNAQAWERSVLTIFNYEMGSDQLRFGEARDGLTSSQLRQITFSGFPAGAFIDASGFVTPIPEPSPFLLLLGGIALTAGLHRLRQGRRAGTIRTYP